MANLLREELIRTTSIECPSCSPEGLARYVIESENTRVCGTCFQELGARNDTPIPLTAMNKLVKRLGRGCQFALVELNPVMPMRSSYWSGVPAYGVLKSLSLLMQHRKRADVKCKLEWFTRTEEEDKRVSRKKPDHGLSFEERDAFERKWRRELLNDEKLRAHGDEAICQIVESILKGLRDEQESPEVTQTSFQPAPGRSFVRFELKFWFNTTEIPWTLQVMRGELSWDTVQK